MITVRLAGEREVGTKEFRCFDLTRSIDLHKLSMEGTHEEAIGGVTAGLIGMDQEVTWRAKHLGITQLPDLQNHEVSIPILFQG